MKTQVNFQYYKLKKVSVVDKKRKEEPYLEVEPILDAVYKKDKKDRRFNLKNDKVCFLEVLNDKEVAGKYKVHYGIFAIAKRDYRPPILDTIELTERENPRTMKEGDKDRVYFAVKVDRNAHPEVTLILQRNASGFNSNSFKNYINAFFRELFPEEDESSLSVDVEMCNSFFSEMQRMRRATTLEVSFDKKILQNNFTSFAGDEMHVEKEVKVSVKAVRSKDLSEMAISVANRMTGNNDDGITNVYVKGYDADNHEMVVNMEKLFRVTSDSVEKSSGASGTGELDSKKMFELLQYYAGL